jgi:hypothetical protein
MTAMVSSREESIEETASASVGQVTADRATIPTRVRAALTLLLESHEYAEDLAADLWDFAVELHTMRDLGLTNSDLRWLVGKQLVDHAREITLPGEPHRAFRNGNPLALSDGTCFVLSKRGVAFAQKIGTREGATPGRKTRSQVERHSPRAESSPREVEPTPKWDRDRQELRFGGQIVKQFKVPAANQETILAAFEEENWPPRIDDPLPPQPDQDPKRRLHDTINSLNRNQKQPLIRFLGDGSGRGIRWEPVVEDLNA